MLTRTDSEHCYHCGELVPPGTGFSAVIGGESRPMCCPGCQAVAQLIAGSGLESFYRLRTQLNETAPPLPGENLFLAYDRPENCSDFVTELDDTRVRAQLLLGGISCAACTWLIEKALTAHPGVSHANVNLSQQALTVEFDREQLPVSELFQRLLALGYDPHPWQLSEGARLIGQEQRAALRELAVAGLAMMQVGMFGIALHAGDIQGIALEYRGLMRWVSLLIASVVVLYSARGFFRNAWNNLRHGRLVMDLPVALAIGLAYLASAWATVLNTGEVYFDSIAMFTFFLLLGRYMERQVRHREFLRQTDLQSLLPVASLRKHGDHWETVPTRSIGTGDILLLRAGDTIPADGVLLDGGGAVDEAAFTGEHLPRSVAPGEQLSAGTVLREGGGSLRVDCDAASSRLATMLSMLSRGGNKPALARLADRVAARFVGAVLVIAALVAAYWWQADPSRALWITLSVLVVSCPCALALATPAALTAATAHLRRRGLLLVGEDSLEALLRCQRVVFDKTGTLTRGELRRLETRTPEGVEEPFALALAAALEQRGRHPIAQAFADIKPASGLSDVDVVPGRGIRGVFNSETVAIGSPAFVSETCSTLPAPPSDPGHWVALASDRQLLAWFALDDTVRADAADTIASLRARGLGVELLTGDPSDAGPRLAQALGLDAARIDASPQDKLDHIHGLQSAGSPVAMVGDGLNDAPVLAAADCAFAVNQATDLAKSQADAILLGQSLAPLDEAFAMASRCRQIIRQNMAWALGYNGLAVPLAAAGWIPPWAAAVGMSASSLLVVLNSLRLRHR